MFAIGDKEWPGISKLMEEAGEVLQVCGKLLATGGKIAHWDGTNLKERLEDELGDLQAGISFVIGWCGLDRDRIERRVIAKLMRFERWHELGETNQKTLESYKPRCTGHLVHDEYTVCPLHDQ